MSNQGAIDVDRRGVIDADLTANPANFTALTPLTFLDWAERAYPTHTAVIYGQRRYDWRAFGARSRALASALSRRGVRPGHTVAVLCPNLPEMLEAHFGVPLAGAMLNPLNIRLDAETIAFMLGHGEAKVLLVDGEFAGVARAALDLMPGERPLVVDIIDPAHLPTEPIGTLDYEALLAEGDPTWAGVAVSDEWQAISLSYTSGTTGDPKGVVYHHRGAYLSSLGNMLAWGMRGQPVYLWTLPMFHCDGWCFTWSLAALGGTHVCLRHVSAPAVAEAIKAAGVTHFCGAPTIMTLLIHAQIPLEGGARPIEMLTAAAPPPAAVIEAMEAMGVHVTHVYGLTEVYGPATVCAPQPAWSQRPAAERAALTARQGVPYVTLEGLQVCDPITLAPLPWDGESLGEVMMRGNMVAKGYLKNPRATAEAFAGGWFHSGDLGVTHPDGYIELKDRSKDIIISGGENISTIEVEGVLYRHPAVLEAAVVAKPHEFWGEVPCAFVTLRPDMQASEAELITHCRAHLAHFKAPKVVVFGPLPKTSTGKVQKAVLRARLAGGE